MATLFDTLKEQLAKPPALQQSQQQQIQGVLTAKTGKAATTSAPKASNLAESQALAQNATALGQQQQATAQLAGDVQTAATNLATEQRVFQTGQAVQAQQAGADLASRGAMANEQIQGREQQALARTAADESMKLRQVNNAAGQKLKELSTQRDLELDEIFSSFDHSNKELEFRKDAAELEQLGFLLALQDQSYVDELKRVGQERGLMDDIAFREEMTNLTLGNNLSDVMDELNFKTTFNATGREYERSLADIDIFYALKFSEAAIRDENNKAVVQGGTEVVKAGVDYWANKSGKSGKSGDSDSTASLDQSQRAEA